jgi:glyceraldehyde-3-phosphate dehydrogenase type I
MGLKVALNGFGRIGKAFLRALLQDSNAKKNINVIAINLGPSSPEDLDTFFKYDSVYGECKENITYKNNKLIINKQEIEILTETNPAKLPWGKLDIDWVVEASGKFTDRNRAQMHLDAGSKNILITAPAKDEDITIIPGVNDNSYDKEKHKIVSLASCTTNCFAPIVKVIKENFELTQGLMTTIHAYTNNQALLDSEHKDPRRGRAAAINIVPTNTGADRVITKIYPELKGKLQGIALRVPVANGSLVDFTFNTTQNLTTESINRAFEKAGNGDLKNILFFCKKPLVSSDFIGSPYSCSIDSLMTRATGTMGKVFGWYDNEFGYCCRLKDFLLHNC